jgi:hypothetical protein
MKAQAELPVHRGRILTDDGLCAPDWKHRSQEFPPEVEVELAMQCLEAHWEPAKSATEQSYSLKHKVEACEGRYLSNGALIAAALRLGLHVVPEPRSGINALVYVKRRRPLHPRPLCRFL